MKETAIVKAAIVQYVLYPSLDAMYRINARKVNYGVPVKYLAIEEQEDGSVFALIQMSYNGKDPFDVAGLLEILRNA